MDQRRRFARIWLAVWLAALLCLPIVEAISVHDSMHRACFAITELEFATLPGEDVPGPADPLFRIAYRGHQGDATICTNEDNDNKSTIEAQWSRITSLTVKLRSPADELITTIPSNNDSPEDLYSDAIQRMFLATRQQLMRHIVITEMAILALAALSWCGGCCFLSGR